MSRAIDPFEEYLRKKKVELLEKQYREGSGKTRPAAKEEEVPARVVAASPEEVEQDARVQEEMDDFFESGTQAGKEYFDQMRTIDNEKVEEIKDALEDVFEEDTARPQANDDSETFVNFFQQVQTEFDGDGPPPGALPHSPNASVSDAPAPTAPTAAPTAPAPSAPAAAPAPAPARVPTQAPTVAAHPDIESTASEVSTDGPVPTPTHPAREGRINLAEILLADMNDAEDLGKRIEVLFRLVAKLVERANVPESEIIEVLIKSDVEF
ncbi:MAG: hypothetical protein OER88_00705 [Planctomycetota bacterium]|nr:hypothetical protein [Planctomycetota bacterium]